jgi:hypothetical protein
MNNFSFSVTPQQYVDLLIVVHPFYPLFIIALSFLFSGVLGLLYGILFMQNISTGIRITSVNTPELTVRMSSYRDTLCPSYQILY